METLSLNWTCPSCKKNQEIPASEVTDQGWTFKRCHACDRYVFIPVSQQKIEIRKNSPRPKKKILIKGKSIDKIPQFPQRAIYRPKIRTTMRRTAPQSLIRNQGTPQIPKRPTSFQTKPVVAPLPVLPGTQNHSKPRIAIVPEPLPHVPQKFDRKLNLRLSIVPLMAVALILYVFDASLQYLTGDDPLTSSPRPKESSIHQKAKKFPKKYQQKIIDRVHSKAMSPKRPQNPSQKTTSMKIRPKNGIINLRSGPGLEYRSIQKADPKRTYQVLDWTDSWYQVLLIPRQSEQAPPDHNPNTNPLWIKSTLVDLVLTQ